MIAKVAGEIARIAQEANCAVLVLHHLDGLTVQECATALGCRPGTARSHLGRAMAKLRRELQDA